MIRFILFYDHPITHFEMVNWSTLKFNRSNFPMQYDNDIGHGCCKAIPNYFRTYVSKCESVVVSSPKFPLPAFKTEKPLSHTIPRTTRGKSPRGAIAKTSEYIEIPTSHFPARFVGNSCHNFQRCPVRLSEGSQERFRECENCTFPSECNCFS